MIFVPRFFVCDIYYGRFSFSMVPETLGFWGSVLYYFNTHTSSFTYSFVSFCHLYDDRTTLPTIQYYIPTLHTHTCILLIVIYAVQLYCATTTITTTHHCVIATTYHHRRPLHHSSSLHHYRPFSLSFSRQHTLPKTFIRTCRCHRGRWTRWRQ